MVTINDIFGEGGWLSRHLQGYQPRPSQMELADKIKLAIESGKHVLAEGPPGTGKSLAYGIPLALHAIEANETVVIATANITLQEQLFNKDFPLIRKVIEKELKGAELSFALIKGMSNYACREKLDELDEAGCPEPWFKEIADWAYASETGDKSELSVEYPAKIWGNVSSTSEECPKRECYYYNKCFVPRFRLEQSSQLVHVVITNYHMLYTDMAVREVTKNKSSLLPSYKLLIMDEAHEAVDIAMGFNGFELSANKLKWMSRGIGKMKGNTPSLLSSSINSMSEKFFDSLSGYCDKGIMRKPLGTDRGVITSLTNAASYIEDNVPSAEEDRVSGIDAKKRSSNARLRMLQETLLKRADELQEVVFGGTLKKLPVGKVYYVTKDSKGQINLCCKTVKVQDFLRRNVLSRKTLVGVSATLSTGGSNKGNLNFVAGEFGLRKEEYTPIIVDSPFDPERVLLVVPNTVPIPKKRDEHEIAVNLVIHKVTSDLGGKTMALFTSYRALRSAAAFLSKRLPGINILVQGQLPKSKIIEQFKQEEHALILATASFWQGVDIPGQALSCLIIDKFPFMPPSDPVLQYMEDYVQMSGGSVFFDYSIPKAVISLKQGVGRLIRTETDYGVIVLCDNRLQTTGYGAQFLRAFPRGHFISENGNIGDVKDFIGRFQS